MRERRQCEVGDNFCNEGNLEMHYVRGRVAGVLFVLGIVFCYNAL